jgi:diguanylate cyclase (GGDEF)-like protein
MIKVLIVGGGKGGAALLPILHDYPEIEVRGVADILEDAPGMQLARSLGLPTSTRYCELLDRVDVDIVIDVSGNQGVSEDLCARMSAKSVELIEGVSANLLFKLVDERRGREQEALSRLKEQEALYKIGIMLASSENEDKLLYTILDAATALTQMPAGSIVLYDESRGRMETVATLGFSESFELKNNWDMREGGLTEYIFNENRVITISDLSKFDRVPVDELLQEGIKSLIATPLVSDRRIIGILYVDDYMAHSFGERERSILSLLATQAAIAIGKMQLYEKMKRLATTDGLTGLCNHRNFVKALVRELSRARRYGHSLSVIILDVDHFKQYNDSNGHLKGNEILVEVTETMKKMIRNADILARYGGEEFAIILPETGKDQAFNTAARICMAVERRRFSGEETQPGKTLTISAGVASFPVDALDEEELLEKADCALYLAKSQGRNRAVRYDECAEVDVIE